jgi:regulator of sigma E protease
MELIPSMSGPWALLLLVCGFGFIIFVHELGHFMVAKWVGIKVSQFALGFGHSLLTYRKGIGFRVGTTEPAYRAKIREHLIAKNPGTTPPQDVPSPIESQAAAELGLGETEYRLNYLPLGGYVKMVGQEDLDPTATSEDPRAYNNKPVWARMCVVSAGVIMNTIFAVVFFIIAFLNGVSFPPAQVGDVEPGSPASTTVALGHPEVVGLRSGDRVIEIDGKATSDFTNINLAVALAGRGDTVDIVVERPTDDGKPPQHYRFYLTPKTGPIGLQYIGVTPPSSLQLVDVTGPDVPAAETFRKIGLKPGSTLIAVDDKPITEYWQYESRLSAAAGRPVKLTFTAKDKSQATVTVTPKTGVAFTDIAAPQGPPLKEPHLLGLVPPIKIKDVMKESPAKDILMPGDVVAAIDGADWPSLSDFTSAVKQSEGRPLPMTVVRNGKSVAVEVKARRTGSFYGKYMLSVELGLATDSNLVARIEKDSPFAPLNWAPGTAILGVGDKQVANFTDLRIALQGSTGEVPVTAKLPLNGGVVETKPVKLGDSAVASLKAIDWDASELPGFQMLRVVQKVDTIGAALAMGYDKTILFMKQTYVTLLRLLQRTVPVSEMRGPLGIADAGTKITQQGVPYLLFFMGLISINLAVINFLPMPIVDGGLFVLLVIEKLRGKPVSPQIASALNLAGLAMIGSIFLFVTYHDILRMMGV